MALIVMAAVWKQISYNFLFFLAGLQSIPQVADRGRGHRRRRARGGASGPSSFPLLSPTTFFLLVINIIYAFFDTFAHHRRRHAGRPGQGNGDPGLQGLLRRLQGADLGGSAAQSVVLMAIVIALTVIQFRFVEKKVSTD